jgi:hypothetical protein
VLVKAPVTLFSSISFRIPTCLAVQGLLKTGFDSPVSSGQEEYCNKSFNIEVYCSCLKSEGISALLYLDRFRVFNVSESLESPKISLPKNSFVLAASRALKNLHLLAPTITDAKSCLVTAINSRRSRWPAIVDLAWSCCEILALRRTNDYPLGHEMHRRATI